MNEGFQKSVCGICGNHIERRASLAMGVWRGWLADVLPRSAARREPKAYP